MIEHDNAPGRVVRLMWASVVTATLSSVALLLVGDWTAAVGFATAAVASLSAVLCAGRWEVWRGIADSFIDGQTRLRWDDPPDGPESQ